jgi:hypothetical protein
VSNPTGDRTCKRCGVHRPKEQFTDTGMVCYACKRASAFQALERRLLTQVAFYQCKLDELRKENNESNHSISCAHDTSSCS